MMSTKIWVAIWFVVIAILLIFAGRLPYQLELILYFGLVGSFVVLAIVHEGEKHE